MTPTKTRLGARCVIALALLTGTAGSTFANDPVNLAGADDAPEWVRKLGIDPSSAPAKRHAAQQKSRLDTEKALRKLRATYFRVGKRAPIRQEGILRLRDYTDAALFPTLIEIFGGEDADVRTALLDHFQDQASVEGDASLAWVAVFSEEKETRLGAEARLRTRMAASSETPETVKLVVYEALRSGKTETMTAAARVANGLNITEAIPWMIMAQIGAQRNAPAAAGASTNGSRQGALAWILVGTQTAFVSDLTPVVGENAVAFDPQLSVVTEGVILRVLDATVFTYRVDLHWELVDLSSRAWGAPTRDLGWDNGRWLRWYHNDLVPCLAAEEAAAAGAKPRAAGGDVNKPAPDHGGPPEVL